MGVMHHNELHVNAPAVDDEAAMEIYREHGWRSGKHKDSDPDDPAEIPAVLPEDEPEHAKTTTRKKTT